MTSAVGGRVGGRYVLNALDRAMLAAHQTLRAVGRPGGQCQAHVWFGSRLDAARFHAASARLARRHPVLTARIVEENGAYYWEARPGVECPVCEVAVADEAAVLRYAEVLLATPSDLDHDAPVGFHLLHLPDGRDVLLVQWVHVLMDRGWLLLQELDRLGGGADRRGELPPIVPTQLSSYLPPAPGAAPPSPTTADLVRDARRSGFAERTVRTTRLAVRTIDTVRAAAVVERVKRACGFVNFIPALAASVLRVWCATGSAHETESLGVAVPLTLRPPGFHYPIFRNLSGHIQFAVPSPEVGEWDALTRVLSRQMRELLRHRLHLALDELLERAPERGIREFLGAPRSQSASHLAFHGSVDRAGLVEVLGTPIDGIQMVANIFSPYFLAVSVTECRGHIDMAMEYDGDTRTEVEAGTLLDQVIADLVP